MLGDRAKLVDTANSLLVKIQDSLLAKAMAFLKENISRPATYSEFKSIIGDRGGFVMAGWCGRQECQNMIKEDTGADIRVLPFDQKDKPTKCIYCGQDGNKTAIFARAY
jgi:prolyl-tRNA synthetase